MFDSNGHLWVGTSGQGVWRVRQRADSDRYVIERVTALTGLAAEGAYALLEDREGNIWVATSRGLDCFAESPVVTFSTNELAATTVQTVFASDDGTVWSGGAGSLRSVQRQATGGKAPSLLVPRALGRLRALRPRVEATPMLHRTVRRSAATVALAALDFQLLEGWLVQAEALAEMRDHVGLRVIENVEREG